MGSTVAWSMAAVQPHTKMERAVPVSGSRCSVEFHLLCIYVRRNVWLQLSRSRQRRSRKEQRWAGSHIRKYVCLHCCLCMPARVCVCVCVCACVHIALAVY